MDDYQSPSLYEDIGLMQSYTPHKVTYIDFKLPCINWAHIRRYTAFRLHGYGAFDSQHNWEHNLEIPNHASTCPCPNAGCNPQSDPESHVKCQCHASCARLIFGGTSILNVQDDGARFTTTLNLNYYDTGSVWTKHHETHLPKLKSSDWEQCTQGSDCICTYRWIKMPYVMSQWRS